MIETPDEYRQLVEQKMLARTERHVRENQVVPEGGFGLSGRQRVMRQRSRRGQHV